MQIFSNQEIEQINRLNSKVDSALGSGDERIDPTIASSHDAIDLFVSNFIVEAGGDIVSAAKTYAGWVYQSKLGVGDLEDTRALYADSVVQNINEDSLFHVGAALELLRITEPINYRRVKEEQANQSDYYKINFVRQYLGECFLKYASTQVLMPETENLHLTTEILREMYLYGSKAEIDKVTEIAPAIDTDDARIRKINQRRLFHNLFVFQENGDQLINQKKVIFFSSDSWTTIETKLERVFNYLRIPYYENDPHEFKNFRILRTQAAKWLLAAKDICEEILYQEYMNLPSQLADMRDILSGITDAGRIIQYIGNNQEILNNLIQSQNDGGHNN